MSIIKNTDSYKLSHFLGYPEGTTEMYSYLESRGGVYPANVVFGYSPLLETLAKGVTADEVVEGADFAREHGLPFNKEGWDHIVQYHNGRLPVFIRAVPEGTLVPTSNVLLDIRNTDDKHAWLTSYLETMLLRMWYPTTVATRIYYMRKKLEDHFEKTADNMDNLPFALLDFSSRGTSSLESSKMGGAAYLVHFLGSDNIPAVDFVNKHYDSPMSGFSVPATEHSIMCAYGENNEKESFRQLIDRMGNNGILSVVSDTWNIFRAVDYWTDLIPEIRAKDLTLVIRPDSGDMVEVLNKIIPVVAEKFGSTINSKGYRVLKNVKILQGDGINEDTCVVPFEVARKHGVSADSIMVGSGGGLMQSNIDRDTSKFAIKGANVTVSGKSIPISKSPITDQGKRSKSGYLELLRDAEGSYRTVNNNNRRSLLDDRVLKPVFHNGEILYKPTIDEIRNICHG